MALDCDVTYNGIERDCEGSVGGLKALWFINRNSITDITFNEALACEVSAMTLAEGTSFAKFGIQPLSSSFTTTVNVDLPSGTEEYETAIVAVFKRMTAEKNCELQKFSAGNAAAIAKDANNRYWLIGVDTNEDDYAIELGDGSTASTGTARTDMNGYTLNLVHYTYHYPYEIPQSVIDTLGLYPAPPTEPSTKASPAKSASSKTVAASA